MQVVFISGAYRAPTVYGITQNIERARAEALKWWLNGYAVICPHSNTALFDGAAPDEVWLKGDLEFVRRSDIIVMLPYWGDSAGAIAEYNLAVELGKKIVEA